MNLVDNFKSTLTSRGIPSLDGLRFLSIVFVIIGHLGFQGQIPQFLKPFMPYIGNHALGVSIFFTLSGFLISSILFREYEKSNTIRLKRFYIRRFYRIFPPFYLYLLILLTLTLLNYIIVPLSEILYSALYIWNYVPSAFNWYVGHTWSLAVEEQFYLLWPFLIITLTPKRAVKLALAFVVLAPLIRIGTYFFIPFFSTRLAMMFHTRTDFIFMGCLLAYAYRTDLWSKLYTNIAKFHLEKIAFISAFILTPYLTIIFKGKFQFVFGYSIEAFSLAIMLIWIVNQKDGIIFRFLNNKFTIHLGMLSYGIYLYQQLTIAMIKHFSITVFQSLLLLYVIVLISYLFLEHPLKTWGYKRNQ